MKQISLLTMLGLILLSRILTAQTMFEKPLSPRNANYEMAVTLNPETKEISGNEVILWRNITSKPVQELQFHLYMNAFQNNQSTHLRELHSSGGSLKRKKAWGWVRIHSIKIKNGQDLTQSISYIQPDDANINDQTVVRVPLPYPVNPGEELAVKIEFTTHLPLVYRRNGYRKDFYFAAQWFPKIGVLEENGWNCHQFHANSEFYSDYGVYDVSLTLPREMVVGSTGVPGKIEILDSLKTVHIHAEDVHDFAWTAWPHWLTEKTTYKGIEIVHLYEKDHTSTVKRTLDAMKMTIDYMDEWVGAYPFPRITILHPPTGTMNVGGMEYPMFVTGGTFWKVPGSLKMTEMVTVHEFGHNWFYGMIGNNEFEEAWLDEGINSYAECRMMDHFYGNESSLLNLPGFRIGELAMQRSNYINSPRRDKTLRPVWTYIGGGYSIFSYNKPALMLWTLENYLTRPVMDKIMRIFFQRWKFKHPHSQDFIDIVNEVTGENYAWFFDQLLKGSGDLDYRIASVNTGTAIEMAGMFDSDSGLTLLPKGENLSKKDTLKTETKLFKSTVLVNRAGEVSIPVEILLVFEDGDSLKYQWDGRVRWKKYQVEHPSKLSFAAVDPDFKLVLDKKFANNSLTVEPRKGPVNYITTRFIMFIESALQIFAFLG